MADKKITSHAGNVYGPYEDRPWESNPRSTARAWAAAARHGCCASKSSAFASRMGTRGETASRHTTRGRACLTWLARVASLVLCATSLGMMGGELHESTRYRALEEEVIERPAKDFGRDEQETFGIAWDRLRAANPDVTGWVLVRGTDISLPVVKSDAADPTFYLTHDLWGDESVQGTPFLDHRCCESGSHLLIYGHHLPLGGQFSQLQKAHEQEVFDRLGPCLWSTPQRSRELRPLCALSVDEWFAPVQHFAFSDEGDLQDWLIRLCLQASARAPTWEADIRGVTTVVTLVTCSSDFAHQPWRTLVMFVGG